MTSLASLQATFNTYTMQRLALLEVMSGDYMSNIEKESVVKRIADSHGVDFHIGKRITDQYLKNLISIIDSKMQNFNAMILEFAEHKK